MADWENDPAIWGDKSTPQKKAYWDSAINKAGIGGKISNPAPKGIWDQFMDTVHNTFDFAGSGLNAMGLRGAREARDEEVIRADAQSRGMTPQQADAVVKQNLQGDAKAIRETRTQQAIAQEDDSNRQPNQSRLAKIGRGAARMAGTVVGDINPTYAIPVLGESLAGRVVGQSAVGGVNDMVAQADELNKGIIDEADPVQTLKSMAAGAIFQLPFEAPGIVSKGVQTFKTKKLIEKGAAHQDFGDVVAITQHSESNDRPNAVSPKGATGLMQVMPETAKKPGYGIKPSNGTAADTQRVGVQLLARHVGHYDGDMEKAWAAYNWGQGNLDRAIKAHGDDWYKVAPRETQDYVAKNMVALGKRAPETAPIQSAEAVKAPAISEIPPELMDPPGNLGLTDVHPDPFGGPPEGHEPGLNADLSSDKGKVPEAFSDPIFDGLSDELAHARNLGVPDEAIALSKRRIMEKYYEPKNDNLRSIDGGKGFLKSLWDDESGSFNPFGKKKYDPNAPEAVHEPGHEPGGAIDRLSGVLQNLNKKRPEQEKLFSDQRTEQMKAASATGKHTDGVEGLYQEMSHMKGELKRPDIAPQGDKFEPHHLDELLKIVKENPRLNMYESINARKAIADLLTSDHPNLPTRGDIELLKKALPGKLVDQLTDKSLMDKFKEGTVSTLNVPRALMASMDVSAPFRQGIFLVGRKEFWKNIGPMLKMFVNPKYYRASMDAIEAHPNYRKMVKAGLALTDTSGDISHAEEAFIGANMAEKIPLVGLGVKASERAYVGFLNKLRADTFNGLYAKGKEIGKDWKANDGAGLKALANYINNATGRGEMGKLTQAAPLLANVFFSPRLMASRINLMKPSTYMQKDAFVRKEAIKDLLRFGSIATSVLGLASFAGADVSTDPGSSDFLKIKNGNLRVSILGGFESYLRLAIGLTTYAAKAAATGKLPDYKYGQTTELGKIAEFGRYKLAPIPSLVADFFAGSDAVGKKVTLTSAFFNRVIPLVVQDVYDVYSDKGAMAAIGIAPVAAAGFGVQDYQPRAPKEKKVRSSSNASWESDPTIWGGSKPVSASSGASWENDPSIWGKK